jgi:hypothetical protein
MGTMNFRLEFNESQQHFHHANMSTAHEPNTHGWVTVQNDATNDYCRTLEIYVKSFNKKHNSADFVVECNRRLLWFIDELKVWNLQITHK